MRAHHYVTFLGKALHYHTAPHNPGVGMGTSKQGKPGKLLSVTLWIICFDHFDADSGSGSSGNGRGNGNEKNNNRDSSRRSGARSVSSYMNGKQPRFFIGGGNGNWM